jgi:DNA polymerase III epsilon subunit-like protein
MIFLPFSHNIVFFDTEFSSLDPRMGEILSIGMVKYSGDELYLELQYDGETSDWVKQHVLKNLTGPKLPIDEAKQKIQAFLGDSHPFAVSFVNNFDATYFQKIFTAQTNPFHWIFLDLGMLLFMNGVDPVSYSITKGKAAFQKALGLDVKAYRHHNALDDARLLRDTWFKLEMLPPDTDLKALFSPK